MLRVASLALCAALLAACEAQDAVECPGDSVASFAFSGGWVAKGDPAIGVDPAADTQDCGGALSDRYRAASVSFGATLAAGPGSEAAALCTSGGVVWFGRRDGDDYVVETGTAGAVLAECGAACSAEMHAFVAGKVVRAGDLPVAFDGVLVEVMTPTSSATCTCTLPCAARFALDGTP